MPACDAGRVFASGGDRGHRQGRGVGGEDRVGGDDALELLEQGLLGRQRLDDRLDHHVAAGELGQARDRLQAPGSGLRRVGGHLTLLGGAPGHLGDELGRLTGGVRAAVMEPDVEAGGDRDLGDAAAHRAGADHPDGEVGLERDLGHQRPSKLGLRLPRKASMPSFWSFDANSRCIALRSSINAVSSEASWPASTTSLIDITDKGGSDAIWLAVFNAVGSTSSSGTTSLARPMRSASSALIMAPVMIMRIAWNLPTARVRRCVPPAPGMMPTRTSGRPNFAPVPAMMMSQCIASSQPPPSAKPLTP